MAEETLPQTTQRSQNGKPLRRIDPTALRFALDYDAKTGGFTWRHRLDMPSQFNARYAGKVAGYADGDGYWKIKINGVMFKSHRLAWVHVTGEDAPPILDHIDGDPSNNRFANLRAATHGGNMQNACTPTNNTSGVKGVYWNAQCGKWHAQIRIKGCNTYLGLFADIESAAAAYSTASAHHHGEFGRTT